MMYGLRAITEYTLTSLALGYMYVCMLVKTNFQNKAGKKGFNFYLWSITAQENIKSFSNYFSLALLFGISVSTSVAV